MLHHVSSGQRFDQQWPQPACISSSPQSVIERGVLRLSEFGGLWIAACHPFRQPGDLLNGKEQIRPNLHVLTLCDATPPDDSSPLCPTSADTCRRSNFYLDVKRFCRCFMFDTGGRHASPIGHERCPGDSSESSDAYNHQGTIALRAVPTVLLAFNRRKKRFTLCEPQVLSHPHRITDFMTWGHRGGNGIELVIVHQTFFLPRPRL